MKIAHMLLAITAVMVSLAACGTTNQVFIERPGISVFNSKPK